MASSKNNFFSIERKRYIAAAALSWNFEAPFRLTNTGGAANFLSPGGLNKGLGITSSIRNNYEEQRKYSRIGSDRSHFGVARRGCGCEQTAPRIRQERFNLRQGHQAHLRKDLL